MDIKSNDTVSLEKILNLGTLQVPKFQRDYSWSKSEWKDLWEDIDDTADGSMDLEPHYMGYIVLQEGKAPKDLHIIDGQQRITTLSMLLLAIIKSIKELDPTSESATILLSNYIGKKTASSLETTNNLVLNSHNNPVYSDFLKKHADASRKGMIGSNRLLCGAFDFFKGVVVKKCGKSTDALAKLAENIAENLYFTYITASRDTNIYKIYQTLNARGLELSISDLLKNHLFTIIDKKKPLDEKEIDKLQDDWREIEDMVGAPNLARFISLEWNRRNEFCRKKELFQKISKTLDTPNKVRTYLHNLDKSSKLYARLLKYDSEFWASNHPRIATDIGDCLECLSSLAIKSPHGLLLTALEKMAGDTEKIKSIIRIITAISVRYNCICQRQANIQEQTYSKIANAIHAGKFAFDDETKQMFRGMYPSDTDFIAEFTTVEFNSTAKPKYLLLAIESHINKRDLLDKKKATLEHVLPKKPSEEWKKDFPKKIHENYIHRLGNMTLLPRKPNSELSNKSFGEKKKEFQESSVLLTKEHVCKHATWNSNSIEEHQSFLAQKALEIWSIDWASIK